MDAYRIGVLAHIVFGIVLVGQALFWLVMLAALRQRFAGAEVARWLNVTRQARWPHVALPQALRLPLPLVGWLTLLVLVISGYFLIELTRAPAGPFWTLKLVSLLFVVVMQAWISARPAAIPIVANFIAVLGAMLASAWYVRG